MKTKRLARVLREENAQASSINPMDFLMVKENVLKNIINKKNFLKKFGFYALCNIQNILPTLTQLTCIFLFQHQMRT